MTNQGMTSSSNDPTTYNSDENGVAQSSVDEPRAFNIPPVKFGLIVLFVSVGSLILAMVGLELFKRVAQPADMILIRRISSMVGYAVFALVPALLLVKLQPWSVRKLIHLEPVRPLIVLLAVMSVVALIPPSVAFFNIQVNILTGLGVPETWLNILQGYDAASLEESSRMMLARSFPELVFVIFVIGVTPGICEELIFRGVIFGSFLKGTTPKRAIPGIGLLFAVVHFIPFMFIAMTLGGAFLAWVTYRSGSIIPAITAHITYNSLVVIGMYALGDEEPAFLSEAGLPMLLVAGVCLLVFAVGTRYIDSLTRTPASN